MYYIPDNHLFLIYVPHTPYYYYCCWCLLHHQFLLLHAHGSRTKMTGQRWRTSCPGYPPSPDGKHGGALYGTEGSHNSGSRTCDTLDTQI